MAKTLQHLLQKFCYGFKDWKIRWNLVHFVFLLKWVVWHSVREFVPNYLTRGSTFLASHSQFFQTFSPQSLIERTTRVPPHPVLNKNKILYSKSFKSILFHSKWWIMHLIVRKKLQVKLKEKRLVGSVNVLFIRLRPSDRWVFSWRF